MRCDGIRFGGGCLDDCGGGCDMGRRGRLRGEDGRSRFGPAASLFDGGGLAFCFQRSRLTVSKSQFSGVDRALAVGDSAMADGSSLNGAGKSDKHHENGKDLNHCREF